MRETFAGHPAAGSLTGGIKGAIAASNRTQPRLRLRLARMGILLTALTFAFALAGSPSALADDRFNTSWGGYYFKSYGDVMTVHDWANDGYGVYVEATVNYSTWYRCWNRNGFYAPSKTCDWNTPENVSMAVWMYRTKDGSIVGKAATSRVWTGS